MVNIRVLIMEINSLSTTTTPIISGDRLVYQASESLGSLSWFLVSFPDGIWGIWPCRFEPWCLCQSMAPMRPIQCNHTSPCLTSSPHIPNFTRANKAYERGQVEHVKGGPRLRTDLLWEFYIVWFSTLAAYGTQLKGVKEILMQEAYPQSFWFSWSGVWPDRWRF